MYGSRLWLNILIDMGIIALNGKEDKPVIYPQSHFPNTGICFKMNVQIQLAAKTTSPNTGTIIHKAKSKTSM